MTKRKIILGEYLEFEKGISVPRDRLFITNNIAYLHYGDIYKIYNHVVDIHKREIDEKYKKTQLLKDGDIVYNLTSESVDDLGKAVYIRNPNNIPFVSGMETTIMRVTDKSILLPEYLNYILSTYKFKCLLRQYVTGMKVYRVHPRDIGRIEIEVPDINEQKKIIDILNPFNDKIELNNQMNQTLEEIASLLYKRWFVDFEFPDDKGNPYKSSGGEMVDSELGMIPKGWEVKELGEVLEISSGNRPVQKSEEKTKENIFPIVGASKIMGYTNNYILDDTNEVLIIGRVGTLGIIQEYREKIWVSDNTLIIKSNFQNYIKQYLSNVDFYSLNSGSTQPLITQTTINKLLIVVPCNKVTDKFEKIESSNVRIKFCNTYEIKKIQRLKLELLKELI